MVDTTLFHKARIGRGWTMRLKPKSTVQNPKALVYRRFTQLEDSYTANVLYHTEDGAFWAFNARTMSFKVIDIMNTDNSTIIEVSDVTTILEFNGKRFMYMDHTWIDDNLIITKQTQYLEAKFGNIARYQTNKYYFVGSFDYMIRGSIEGTTTQHIKGNIMPLTSMNIKYFNDDIDLDVDDLVVIDDHLYSVENPETTQKRMPKAFKVHFATLNSIL